MGKYKVIVQFADLQDNGHIYNIGDDFPRKGKRRVSAERIYELASYKNKIGKPLIRKIVETEEVEENETPDE